MTKIVKHLHNLQQKVEDIIARNKTRHPDAEHYDHDAAYAVAISKVLRAAKTEIGARAAVRAVNERYGMERESGTDD